jgi:uncharacterized LabA/DUF88 family protein
MISDEQLSGYEDNFLITKTAEEAGELTTALLQYLTKPITKHKEELIANIVEEIVDVEIMIDALKRRFNLDREVEAYKIQKLLKYQEYYKKLGADVGKLRKENP